jgi:hypothetical protein
MSSIDRFILISKMKNLKKKKLESELMEYRVCFLHLWRRAIIINIAQNLLYFKMILADSFYLFFLGTIRITPTDSRWVGAWWLSFLVSGLLSILSSIPFFFLPKNPNIPQKERKISISSHTLKTNKENHQTDNLASHGQRGTIQMSGKYFTFIMSFELLISVKEKSISK